MMIMMMMMMMMMSMMTSTMMLLLIMPLEHQIPMVHTNMYKQKRSRRKDYSWCCRKVLLVLTSSNCFARRLLSWGLHVANERFLHQPFCVCWWNATRYQRKIMLWCLHVVTERYLPARAQTSSLQKSPMNFWNWQTTSFFHLTYITFRDIEMPNMLSQHKSIVLQECINLCHVWVWKHNIFYSTIV